MTLKSRIKELEKKIRQRTRILDKIENEILKIKARWKKGHLAAKAREDKIDQRILEGKRTDTIEVKKMGRVESKVEKARCRAN